MKVNGAYYDIAVMFWFCCSLLLKQLLHADIC